MSPFKVVVVSSQPVHFCSCPHQAMLLGNPWLVSGWGGQEADLQLWPLLLLLVDVDFPKDFCFHFLSQSL